MTITTTNAIAIHRYLEIQLAKLAKVYNTYPRKQKINRRARDREKLKINE